VFLYPNAMSFRADRGDFTVVPWCAELINDPEFVPSITYSRIPKKSTEDSFFAETLATDRTIRECLTIHSRPNPDLEVPIQEVRTFLNLGSGVNGYPNVCHGGFVATMLDEVMGVLLTVNQLWIKDHRGGREHIMQMTAFLNIKFKQPVRTPQIVLTTAKISKLEPRKWYITGTIEDSNRQILSTGEALFVEARTDPRL